MSDLNNFFTVKYICGISNNYSWSKFEITLAGIHYYMRQKE